MKWKNTLLARAVILSNDTLTGKESPALSLNHIHPSSPTWPQAVWRPHGGPTSRTVPHRKEEAPWNNNLSSLSLVTDNMGPGHRGPRPCEPDGRRRGAAGLRWIPPERVSPLGYFAKLGDVSQCEHVGMWVHDVCVCVCVCVCLFFLVFACPDIALGVLKSVCAYLILDGGSCSLRPPQMSHTMCD